MDSLGAAARQGGTPCPDENTVAELAEGSLPPNVVDALERHVDACPNCRELLAALGRGAEPPAPEEAHTLVRGDAVGRYIVIERLGAGGMGVVYAAYDPDLDRKVALKLLRDDVLGSQDGEEARARMLSEAKALAKLTHPNVVTVYEVGTWCGQVYMALEFVEGRDVSAWLEADRSPAAIVQIYAQAGEGLAAAHAAGLVHRDFKPGNVLIGRDGRARVADFGLARSAFVTLPPVATELPTEALVTNASRVMGTPAYMAPEQLRGARVDPRADQFSFCVALYESLCGQLPFGDADNLATLIQNTEAGRVRSPPGRAKVPAQVWRVLRRGMNKNPGARYRSMDQLVAQLVPRAAGRWAIWAPAGALVLALAGVAAWTQRQSDPSEEQLAVIEELESQARRDAAEQRFLYPPPDDPEAATAYRSVLGLERIDDGSGGLARERAKALRTELSLQLIELGDQYWERPGGRAYAVDFYAIALVFDPDSERARERVSLSPGELANLRGKAETQEFTDRDLVAAEPLAALADPNEDARAKRLRAIEKKPDRGSATSKPAVRELLEDIERRDAKRTRSATKPVATVAKDTRPPPPQAARNPPPAPPPPKVAPAEPKPQPKPARAKELFSKGRVALKAGDLGKASVLFNRALAADPGYHRAIMGLSDVAFERADYGKAASLAERAVRRAPGRASYRVALGDALLKEMRPSEARTQYQKAVELGSKAAVARLARVESKLGGRGK